MSPSRRMVRLSSGPRPKRNDRMRSVENNMVLGRFRPVAIRDTASKDASIQELLAFERMLADISARLANVAVDRVESEMQLAQVMLREFLGFDRSTFAEFHDDGSLVVLSSNAAEGVSVTSPGPLPERLAWFMARLRSGDTLVIQDPAIDLPPEAVGEAEYFKKTGLRSHVSIPLRIGGHVIGAIAFASFREVRTWPDDLIPRLKLVGEVFAHAIARKREQEKLLSASTEIKVLKDRLLRENSYLRHAAQIDRPQRLTSQSPGFRSVIEEVGQVARTSSTVLLQG